MKKLGRTWTGRRYANLLVIIILAIILTQNLNIKYLKVNLTTLSISTTTISTISNSTTTSIINDGCGRVNDRNSSTWRNLQPSEIANSTQVQTCLTRIGRSNAATLVNKIGLNCSTHINFETIQSTISQYDTVWLHGDSIMEQTFYTLACLINSSINELPTDAELGGPDKMRWTLNLAEQGRLIEKFTYIHSRGKTEFRYSRYGLSWGLQDNLYKFDFPYAVKTLTSKDIILTTGASAHYTPSKAPEYEKALEFIASQSKLSNASIYLFEPTPEDWPTSNGQYTPSCMWQCECGTLSEERMKGRVKFITRDKENDEQYMSNDGKPEAEFFQKLYPNMNMTELTNRNCIPNCLPNSWRTEVVRKWENNSGKVHLIPIYWQLASIPNGNTGRKRGDCTHRNLYGTELMISQWIRTILLES